MALFSEQALVSAAGDTIFGRGLGYVPRVSQLQVGEASASCTVTGTDRYYVKLDWQAGAVNGSCTCPHFMDGYFCKHLVACGLAVLGGSDGKASGPTTGGNAGTAQQRSLTSIISDLDAHTAQELLVLAAERDPGFARLLRSRAADDDELGSELLGMARAGMKVYGFIDYRSSFDAADQVGEVLAELEMHLNAGRAEAVREPLLHVVKRMRRITQQADDSAGVLGDQESHAVELYAEACSQSPVDGRKLARWLVKYREDSPGWPNVTLQMFIAGLGDKGLQSYRREVAKLAEKYGDETGWHRFDFDRMRLELADHDGDVDSAVRILAVGESPQYGEIVNRLASAGREAEMMRWVERAVEAGRLAGSGNEFWLGLDDILSLYLRDGRDDDAVEVAKNFFERRPGVTAYRALVYLGEKLHREEELHAWALTASWELTGSGPMRDNPGLAIALYVEDLDLAWQAADRFGARGLWKELAQLSAEPYPQRSYALYRAEVERLIPHTDTRSYPVIANYLATMRGLAERDNPGEFQYYLHEIRSKYGNRPRMMKEFARYGL